MLTSPTPRSRPSIWRTYFDAYGGVRALVSSRYLHAAIGMNVISLGKWIKPGWWDEPLAVVPNILGFSLAGYTALLTFGDASFREPLAGSLSSKPSPFIAMNATFVHFIVVQVLTLLVALLCKNTYIELGVDPNSSLGAVVTAVGLTRYAFWFLGYALFLYSLCAALAATMQVLRVARWYDDSITAKRANQPPPPPPHETL